MIDTVVLRFHDINQPDEAHNRLAEWLNRTHTRSGKTVTMTPGHEAAHSVAIQAMHRTTLHYHDTGNVQQVAHFNELKSSHYTIAYKIDVIHNYVEINLSIPKYIFGTNILLYNRPHSSKRFFAAKHNELEINLNEAHKRLFTFLNKFFATEFGSIELIPELIEINRIDVCYNQVFDTKEDALDYLNHCKKLRKKNARDTTNYSRGRNWKSSITYVTDRYSFKIYHKGSEFAKNDAKKLTDINLSGNHDFRFPIPYYQSFADRILRYEMTFRGSQMSYLYMNNIFRSNCYIWEAGVQFYKKAKQAKQKGFDSFMQFRKSLERDERALLDYVNTTISKTKHFFLAVDSRAARFDDETRPDVIRQGAKPERFDYNSPFSPDLWGLLTAQFLKVISEFKLEVHQDHHSILSKADTHNKKVLSDRQKLLDLGIDKKSDRYKGVGDTITISKLKIILQMLETMSFEEIADSNVFARNTWWRHRKLLKSLGLQESSQLSIAVRAEQNLKAYNTEVLFNSSKFINLSF